MQASLGHCDFNSPTEGEACSVCGHKLRMNFHTTPQRECDGPPCPYLGPVIERDGVPIKVKCGCTKKDQEHMLPSHKCEVFGRCLPSARFTDEQAKLWRERYEAGMYAICLWCPLKCSPQE